MTKPLAPDERRQRGRPPIRSLVRPVCPQGHTDWAVQLCGTYGDWGPYQRIRYRCTPPGYDTARKAQRVAELAGAEHVKLDPRPHTFTAEVMPARHPTKAHPHGGEACDTCEKVYLRNEGPATGRNFSFALREIATVLSEVSDGGRFRETSYKIRQEARRPRVNWNREKSVLRAQKRVAAGKLVRVHSGRRVSFGPKVISGETRLTAAYVDVFAPMVLEGHEAAKWPTKVGLDSRPMRAPSRSETGARKSGGVEAGEILCAVDLTVFPREIVKMAVAGGKDWASWADFMRSIPVVEPIELVVADKGLEIAKAVGEVWPTARIYQCEGHLMLNAKKAALADECFEMMPDPTKEADPRTLWGKPRPNLTYSPVWLAIEKMQHSPETWGELKAAVATHIKDDPGHQNLRKWMGTNESLVLDQCHFRHSNHGTPRSSGAVEAVFTDLDRWFVNRRFTNAGRLNLILALMRLRKHGDADARAFYKTLRDRFTENSGRALVDWGWMLDRDGTSSIGELIKFADERVAEAFLDLRRAARLRRQDAKKEEISASRAAASQEPMGRKLRTAPRVYVHAGGKWLTEITEAMEHWDGEANSREGLDPQIIRAVSGKVAWWICDKHIDKGHLHHFQRSVKDRVTDPERQCPHCANKKVCPTNNLAAQYPDIAAEWHPTKNRDLKPWQFVPGSMDVVQWLCTKCPRKHAYPQRINARTLQGQGCKAYADAHRAEHIRKGVTDAARKMRDLGRAVKANRAALQDKLDAVMDQAQAGSNQSVGGLEPIENGENLDLTGEQDIA